MRPALTLLTTVYIGETPIAYFLQLEAGQLEQVARTASRAEAPNALLALSRLISKSTVSILGEHGINIA